MRNPKWHRDEIILALDLYFSHDRGSIDDKNPKIIELSRILNALPLFPERPDKEKFRNASGVTLKLANFLALDPNYHGKGMASGSKLDNEVFQQFHSDRSQLHAIATEIKKIALDETVRTKIYLIEDDEETANDSVREGQVLYKLHKVRERDAGIVKSKKRQAWDLFGKLACEVCIFEFQEYYGEIGKGYIECHHKSPLSKIKLESVTTLDDLALVCSNCHRMLHREIDLLSIEDLRMRIKYDRL